MATIRSKWERVLRDIATVVKSHQLDQPHREALAEWLSARGLKPDKPPKSGKAWVRIKKAIADWPVVVQKLAADQRALEEEAERLAKLREAEVRRAEAAQKAAEIHRREVERLEAKKAAQERLRAAIGGRKGAERLLKAVKRTLRASEEYQAALQNLREAKAEVKRQRRAKYNSTALREAYQALREEERYFQVVRLEVEEETWTEIVLSAHNFGGNFVSQEAAEKEFLGVQPDGWVPRYYDTATLRHLEQIKLLLDAGPEAVIKEAHAIVREAEEKKAARRNAALHNAKLGEFAPELAKLIRR